MSKTEQPPNYAQATEGSGSHPMPPQPPTQQTPTQGWNPQPQPIQAGLGAPPPVMQPGYQQQAYVTQPVVQGQAAVQYSQQYIGLPPKDYMTMSILVTIFCSLILGLIAVYHASESRKAWRMGDAAGAERYANTARTLNIVAIVVGVVLNIVVIGVAIWYVNYISSLYPYGPYGPYNY